MDDNDIKHTFNCTTLKVTFFPSGLPVDLYVVIFGFSFFKLNDFYNV